MSKSFIYGFIICFTFGVIASADPFFVTCNNRDLTVEVVREDVHSEGNVSSVEVILVRLNGLNESGDGVIDYFLEQGDLSQKCVKTTSTYIPETGEHPEYRTTAFHAKFTPGKQRVELKNFQCDDNATIVFHGPYILLYIGNRSWGFENCAYVNF